MNLKKHSNQPGWIIFNIIFNFVRPKRNILAYKSTRVGEEKSEENMRAKFNLI